MAKRKETLCLIAEVDLKCKEAKFYYGSKHLASCYPDKKSSVMRSNVYRYMNGELKTFNKHHYFFLDFEGIAFTPENMEKLREHALGIARAQLKDKQLKAK